VRLWNLAEGVTRAVLLETEVLAFSAAALLPEIVKGAQSVLFCDSKG
jgi:hypothetical protein